MALKLLIFNHVFFLLQHNYLSVFLPMMFVPIPLFPILS
ncbi:putative membrane protein [Bacteroides fragilis str. S24L26]|nr:putative membrane protein [Bacteroides fragilis str. 3783N2-1]EXY53731.1 putative membrane protein [Bacteroides fragilis str. 3976T7]EYA74043.1 putative membrane protein [Bacteroides fragilis str. S24L26]EYA78677.1 putative membrane protein [Bacteroides fragilis str. S24L34]